MDTRKNLVWRNINCKTVSNDAITYLKKWSESYSARWAFAVHPAEGTTPEHYHMVIIIGRAVKCDSLARTVSEFDPHAYFSSCRSTTRALRYLRHLDNPTKTIIPVANFFFGGEWEAGMLENIMKEAMDWRQIASAISDFKGESPTSIASHLLTAGFRPSDITQYINMICAIDKAIHQPFAFR